MTNWRNRIKEVRTVKAEELHENEMNWRRHPKGQASALRGVLGEVGIAAPLLAYYSEQAGGALTLIDGHLRLTTGGEWPTAILDVNDDEAHLLLATMDPLAAMAEADSDALASLLDTVRTDDAAIKDMLNELAKSAGLPSSIVKVDAEPQFESAEELEEKWGVVRGDVWQLGAHRLICGDSTDSDDVALLLDGNRPALMVTDPPYGVNYNPVWRKEAADTGKLAFHARRIGKVTNDDRVDWSAAYKLFPGDVAYTWSPAGDLSIDTGMALKQAAFELRNMLIWRKPHFPISRGHYTYQHEPCWYGVKKGRTAHWVGDANASSVWDITLDKNVAGGHSTQKPLECMERPIRNHLGDVYDPFCGSGTTIMAAENNQRVCYAAEIDPSYCAIILERWLMATGNMPERIVEGEGVLEHAEEA
jgi:DNA modification methylase